MVDVVKITVSAGRGGDGCLSFRREKFVPHGGPDGGDGGKGGNVYFLVDKSEHTLFDFRHQTLFRAKNGKAGQGAKKTGHSGEDLTLKVPIGTIIRELPTDLKETVQALTHKEITSLPQVVDLREQGQEFLIARGGKGGRGNWHFRSSTNRVPYEFEKGKSGEEKELILELRLIADVGIIGLPNAGKSTLISRLTAARPKIAGYAFTTLEPVLGVVEAAGRGFVIAEIPGLIEGAARGKGLGYEFLRHIERTKALIHLIGVDGENLSPQMIFKNCETVNKELRQYDSALSKKPQLVVINKIDLPQVRELLPRIQSSFAKKKQKVWSISAATGEGLEELKRQMLMVLDKQEKKEEKLLTENQ